jgi:hypothetical protein
MSELLLKRFTLDDAVSSEILRYTKNVFVKRDIAMSDGTANEAFTEAFGEIINHADIFGAQYALDELLGSKSIRLSAPALINVSFSIFSTKNVRQGIRSTAI